MCTITIGAWGTGTITGTARTGAWAGDGIPGTARVGAGDGTPAGAGAHRITAGVGADTLTTAAITDTTATITLIITGREVRDTPSLREGAIMLDASIRAQWVAATLRILQTA